MTHVMIITHGGTLNMLEFYVTQRCICPFRVTLIFEVPNKIVGCVSFLVWNLKFEFKKKKKGKQASSTRTSSMRFWIIWSLYTILRCILASDRRVAFRFLQFNSDIATRFSGKMIYQNLRKQTTFIPSIVSIMNFLVIVFGSWESVG